MSACDASSSLSREWGSRGRVDDALVKDDVPEPGVAGTPELDLGEAHCAKLIGRACLVRLVLSRPARCDQQPQSLSPGATACHFERRPAAQNGSQVESGSGRITGIRILGSGSHHYCRATRTTCRRACAAADAVIEPAMASTTLPPRPIGSPALYVSG